MAWRIVRGSRGTRALAATAPGAPTNVTATGGVNSASVAFSPPASNGGAPITGYTATSSPGGHTGTSTASPITVSGLTAGQAYTFTVVATNSAGTSPPSAASNAVTPTGSGTTPTGYPDATNTGVPAGTTLTNSGGIWLTPSWAAANLPGDGTKSNPWIIQDRNITGRIDMTDGSYTSAHHTIIRRCRIIGDTSFAILAKNNTIVEDCEIGRPRAQTTDSNATDNGVFLESNCVVRRCNIYCCRTPIKVGQQGHDNWIYDNYIHDVWQAGIDPHVAGINVQSGHRGVIRHNTIDGWTAPNNGRNDHGISIYSAGGSSRDWVVEDNFIDHSGYHIYGAVAGSYIVRNNLLTSDWQKPPADPKSYFGNDPSPSGGDVTFLWTGNRDQNNTTLALPSGETFPPSFRTTATTGVPAGLSLTSIVATTITSSWAASNLKGSGTVANPWVMDGYTVSGQLTVQVSNLIIRRCRIVGATPWAMNSRYGVFIDPAVTNVTVHDCEIGPTSTTVATDIGIFGSEGCTFYRNNIHNARVGIMFKSLTEVRDNHISNIYVPPSPDNHTGVLNCQTGRDCLVWHNTLDGTTISSSTETWTNNGLSIYTTGNVASYNWTIEKNSFKHAAHHVFGAFGATVRVVRNRFDSDEQFGAFALDNNTTTSLGRPVTSFTWTDNRRQTGTAINTRTGTGPNGQGGWTLAP